MKAEEWVFVQYLLGNIQTKRDLYNARNRCETPYLITDEIVGW